MDNMLYYALVKLLATGVIPSTIGEEVKKLAEKVVKFYHLEKGTLHRLDQGKSTTDPSGGRQHLRSRKVIISHYKNPTLKQVHNSAHLGQSNTYDQVSKIYYWPGMKQDCFNYVRSCPICQKRQRRQGSAPLEPINKTPKPFYQVGIDVMGPLPITTSGFRYIVLAIDHFTKWIEARALKDADAQTIAIFIHDDIICRH